jgi:uncharacterized protein YjhX (UPF0386 family)
VKLTQTQKVMLNQIKADGAEGFNALPRQVIVCRALERRGLASLKAGRKNTWRITEAGLKWLEDNR